jgi:hypothetical protein
MKFIKRQALSRNDPMNNAFAVEIDGRIVTNSTNSLQLPKGSTFARPDFPGNGQMRYNEDLNDNEIYNITGQGTGWEKIKTNRQSPITVQTLGQGNYNNNYFGPLAYNVSISKPQNVLVFVENVYQIPNTNYTLVSTNGFTTTALTVGITGFNASSIVLTTTTNLTIGMTIEATTGILPGTTVTNVDTVSKTISIDPTTNGSIAGGTVLSFVYPPDGVLVTFSSPPPTKPVTALLGFDGYAPPNN